MATEVWTWQGGTDQWDKAGGVSVGPDGSCTLAGWTHGDWGDEHAGAADWAAVNLDATGALQWKWQGGTERYEYFHAAATGQDGSVVMVGHREDETVAVRLAAVKLDADGGLVWEWEDESRAMAEAFAVATTEDGGAIWAGSTFGVWGEKSYGDYDFTASKMDEDGTILWSWQNGTAETDELNAVVVGDDGTVVLAGYTNGDWTSLREGDGDADFAAVKLDAEGNELWRWQDGTTGDDTLHGAANGHDGSTVLAGVTEGSWEGAHAGGKDFCAVKLDADGGEVWRWQGGTNEDDFIVGVAAGNDGSAILAGYTKGAWSGSSDGSYDLAAVKLDADGTVVWRWQAGAILSAADYGVGVAAGPDGSVVLAGYTEGSWGEEDNSEELYDFVVVMLDTDDAAAAPSPTTGILPVADALLSTPTPTGIRDSSTLAPELPSPATAIPSSPSPAPLAAMRTSTPGPSSYTLTPELPPRTTDIPSSPSPAPLVAMRTSTPGPSSYTLTPELPLGATPIPSSPSPAPLAAMRTSTPGPSSSTLTPELPPRTTALPSSPSPAPSAAMRTSTPGPSSSTLTPELPPRTTAIPSPSSPAPSAATHTSTHGPSSYTLTPELPPRTTAIPSPSSPAPSAATHTSTHGPSSYTLTPELPPRATAIPSSPSPAPLAAMRTSTPGPSSYIPSFGVSTSPASAFRAPVSRAPASAAPATYATVEATSAAATSFSPVGIGIVALAATVALIVAGVCLRMRHQAKQNSDDKGDKDVPVITAGQGGAATTPDAETSACGPCAPSGTRDVVLAVLDAANDLALNSQFPGVSEAATLVVTLVNLISNDRGRTAESEARLKRCRLLVTMLQQAATVLGKIDNVRDTESSKEMKLMLIENVQDAIGDMVGLIKTYNSKKRITQVVVSTLFKRRMEETEAVINQTFSDLMRWLHIDTALNQEETRRNLASHRGKATRIRRRPKLTRQHAMVGPYLRRPTAELQAESIVSDRRLRRLRNLNQIEIPENHVVISEDMLGKGGFGTVFIADYNGRNAAAKVIRIDRYNEQSNGSGDEDAKSEIDRGKIGAKRQRASLLMELQAMIRLRSPHTVNVYGAITSRKDKLILVMELLTGGDLCTFLKHSTKKIPEPQARTILQDVCAGMAFLHSKSAVHGDLKSANVLLDGEGRAKIGDFGTSRWAQHSNSTGLATYNPTHGNVSNTMSFAWAAPEVLSAKGTSSASDVYSFGIVAWEVLSMEVPWADEALPFDIYTRVVFKGDRPVIPGDAPVDIADVLRACWAALPEARPASGDILEMLKASALNPKSGATEYY